jgi:RNA polymerase sigma factor (sigma-70 family)
LSSQPNPAFAQSLELLRLARKGDAAALSRLLERYSERLLGRVRLMMGAEARAQAESVDFLQMTMTEVLERMDRFEVRDERAFLAWLTTIARNRIRDSVRRQRETAFASLSASCSQESGGPGKTPASEVADHEQALRLVEALEELDDPSRQIVELRNLEGLSYREIGERLGFGEDRARQRHQRAVLRLGYLLSGPSGR